MDRGAWWAAVHGVAKSPTRLNDFHFSLSCIGEGNGNPLQCSCLENPRDSGAWWGAVYGVAQSPTQLTQQQQHNSRGKKFFANINIIAQIQKLTFYKIYSCTIQFARIPLQGATAWQIEKL